MVPSPLPRIRLDLDFMPSPVEDRPGLLIRDPFQYSSATLIVPPPLVAALECFDGEKEENDLREVLVRSTGQLQVSEIADHLRTVLSESGFLLDEHYDLLREARHREFAANPARAAAHAGSAYPEESGELRSLLQQYLEEASPARPGVKAIAAPHVSPEGGWSSYRDAFSALPPDYGDKTFIILGTSHYGEPERFGLTRKPFVTPLGQTQTAVHLVDELERKAGEAIVAEDYCHAVEHSIEFQVVFLQHLFGPSVRILPVLCGAFAQSIYFTGRPEDCEPVGRFLDVLGEINARENGNLCWVLGIDMAHMGRRYGDPFSARAGQGDMQRIEQLDRARIAAVNRGDADEFWSLVQEDRDPLKWCGSSPLYTFLRAVPELRGSLRRYEQWNIDGDSVVSFAALDFAPAP
jgi:AmmeMemoRadiSam system protein B